MKLEYKDYYGNNQPLGNLHIHELLDRISCMQVMVEDLLQNHPASCLVERYLDKAQKNLSKAYQKIGQIEFDMKDDDE